ncbi:MAG: maleylpyruvate isomerase N-terminal domain-containing protein [Ornithinimicrobium sp.]
MHTWVETREAFDAAARWFAATVPSDSAAWVLPGLGVWSVRDLVGHTSRALLTVESYLQQPAPPVQVTSPAEYVALAMASVGDPQAVAQRGRDAGAALGDDLVSSVRVVVERVTTLVAGTEPTAVAATPVGAMHLQDYLPTRTFELTVHTCDLAVALGEPVQPPDPAAAESVGLVADLALRSGQAPALLLASTGRRALPSGFSVL